MLVFVYGSLKEGFGNHRLISSFKKIGEGTIEGKMYSLGAFPAVVLDKENPDLIHGEIYDVNTESGLERLDMLEGYRPNEKNNFYDRVEVKCTFTDNTKKNVLVYVMHKKSLRLMDKPYIESGIWTH